MMFINYIYNAINKFLNMIIRDKYRIIYINGIYDIICGMCVLGIYSIPFFNKIHLNMFYEPLDPTTKRFFGYYLLLQGACRTTYLNDNNNNIAWFSYILEALIFIYESLVHETVDPIKGLSVSISCLIFASVCSPRI